MMGGRTKSLKTLHVTGTFPIPPLGGMEMVTYCLPIELARQDFQVRVVCGTSMPRLEVIDGAQFIGLRSVRLSNWIWVPTPEAYHELNRLIEWADIVHIHNPAESIPLFAGWRSINTGKRTFFSILFSGMLRKHPRLLFRALGSIDELLVSNLLRRATRVQVKNVIDRERVSAITDRVCYIPDGIEKAIFEAPPDRESFLRGRNLLGRSPILLYLGRIHPYKGPSDFIEAAKFLQSSYPGLLGIIAGTGPTAEIARLRDLIHANLIGNVIYLAGSLTPQEKIAALDAADVVVVPSRSEFVEGFSIVSSEAWGRKRPVAAYPVGALKARVKNGINGFLAEDVSPRSLAEAIRKSLTITLEDIPEEVVPWSEIAKRVGDVYREMQSHPSSAAPDVLTKDDRT